MYRFLCLFVFITGVSAFCPLNAAQSSSRPKCFAYWNYPLSFDQADAFCYNLGGRLASVTDAFESNVIQSLVRSESPTVNAYWIGIRAVDGKPYAWVDETPLNYLKWAANEPQYECGMALLSSGNWATTQCPQALPFACALDPLSSAPPCESEWTWLESTASCYKVVRNFNSYDAAENVCLSMGAHLASIHTLQENDFIFDQGTANYKLGVTEHDLQTWIGLKRDCDSCQWYWTDGSKVDYKQWTKGEPADDYANQDCVEIYTDEASGLGSSNVQYWNNVKCDNDKRNAICKKPQRNATLTYH